MFHSRFEDTRVCNSGFLRYMTLADARNKTHGMSHASKREINTWCHVGTVTKEQLIKLLELQAKSNI